MEFMYFKYLDVITFPQMNYTKWSQVGSQEIPEVTCKLEKVMATHSSTLAWKIPWTEEPGRLQSMGLQKVRHNWATSLSLFTFMHWRRPWQPTPMFLPRESQGRGAWWAAVYGVAQSRTQLKQLSSSSQELMMDREVWHAGVAKSWTWLSDWTDDDEAKMTVNLPFFANFPLFTKQFL